MLLAAYGYRADSVYRKTLDHLWNRLLCKPASAAGHWWNPDPFDRTAPGSGTDCNSACNTQDTRD
jgi:hypothetical protein